MKQSPAPDTGLPSANAAATPPPARSLTAVVYGKIRADIIANRLKQNEKLPLARLQDQYDVSLSVVREALSRLVADGLVIATDHRGFRVSPISRDDLVDLTHTRIGIECLAIEQALGRGGPGWRARVDATYGRMARIVHAGGSEPWGAAHADFHRTLLEPCASHWLLHMRDVLFEQSERYRLASVDLRDVGTIEATDHEHRALRDAMLDGNATAAKRVLAAHFLATMERVLAAMPAS